jgi:putative ABC transport system substrate-binding protein
VPPEVPSQIATDYQYNGTIACGAGDGRKKRAAGAKDRRAHILLAAAGFDPALYSDPVFATDGGLLAYGPDRVDQFRRAADYVDRILKGEKPADLPVQAPTKYELVINLTTAKALGLDVPPTLLARADEVIE